MKRYIMGVILLCLCLIGTGCGETPPPQPPVEIKVIRVLYEEGEGETWASYHAGCTLVENTQTNERRMVPGVWGEPEDVCKIPHYYWSIRNE